METQRQDQKRQRVRHRLAGHPFELANGRGQNDGTEGGVEEVSLFKGTRCPVNHAGTFNVTALRCLRKFGCQCTRGTGFSSARMWKLPRRTKSSVTSFRI